MRWVKELRLLLWKNFILALRKPVSAAFEILLPIFFIFILLVLRITKIQSSKEGMFTFLGLSLGKNVPLTRNQSWTVLYTPNSTVNNDLMKHVPQYLTVKVVGYASESLMIDTLVSDNEKVLDQQSLLCGVIFHSNTIKQNSTSTQNFDYTLRFPAKPRVKTKTRSFFKTKWNTAFVFPFTFQGLGPRGGNDTYGGPPSYYNESFLAVQRAIDYAFIKQQQPSFDASKISTKVERFPYPSRIKDPFIVVIQNSLPLLLMLSLVYTALLMVRNIVYEKEKKLKESMKMMGLSGWLHWLAWFIKCFTFLFISISIITIFLTVDFGGKGKMLMASDGSVVFIFLILYAVSAIMFCFFVSTLFYRANIAAASGGILWFLSYTPYFFLANYYDRMSTTSKVLACLDFNIAMSFGSNLIGRFEGQGSGVQWDNISKGVTVDETFTFGYVLLMLIADSVLYGLLTWYVEGIFPGEYGIPKKWYFPFSRKYWCDVQEMEDEVPLVQVNTGYDDDDNDENDSSPQPRDDYIEKVDERLTAGIKIRNLTKVFKTETGKKVAVNNLNLNMYEGQITALLGHNGAGKTTTISMLTGLFPPTSGNAVVNGYDILYNMNGVRRSLGLCPQHNVLFDNLTVKEHLLFFCYLKGGNNKDAINQEVERMVTSIGLIDKKNVKSKNLSGGMKRKLSVGIALVGDSKIVMLDEPTSGMDVSARRFTWELLQRERRGRTMILTTHYMDEADVLGDRIAIMANGQIKCCGSSLFLKKKFGVGYHMVMVKDGACDVDRVVNLIKSFIPTAEVESNVGLELSVTLPSEYSNKFEDLFSQIEEHRVDLGIVSYGASVTTMEEVFIKVGEEADLENNTTHQKLFRQLSGKDEPKRFVPGEGEKDSRSTTPVANNSSPAFRSNTVGDVDVSFIKNTGMKLFAQRWYAMFVKKLLHSKRHKASIISQLVVPCIFVLLSLIVVKTMPKATDSPARTLNLQQYGFNYVPYSAKGNSSLLNAIKDSLKENIRATSAASSYVPSKTPMVYYILQKEKVDLAKFNLDHLIAVELDQQTDASTLFATAWYNNEAFHSAPVAVNTLSNALLNSYSKNTKYRITTTNFPLPPTTKGSLDDLGIDPNGFQIGFSLVFGMAFLASSFVVFLVQERSTKAKHIQFVSGVDPISYWTSSYLWDLINFLLPTILIILLFVAFQFNAYTGPRIGYVFLLLILYGWAIIPLMYSFTFAFQVASTAFTRMTILNVITGLATLLVVYILSIPSLDLLDIANALKWVFLILPNYNLGQGMVDLFNNYNTIEIYNRVYNAAWLQFQEYYHKCVVRFGEKYCHEHRNEFLDGFNKLIDQYKETLTFQTNYLAWDNPGIGRFLIFLALEGFLFFGVVLILEYGVFSCKSSRYVVPGPDNDTTSVLDSDVLAEKQRIENDQRGNDVLVLKNLSKAYGSKILGTSLKAVDGLSLGIPHGECFGLLGQNGAGKTTTFKMLTGDESITSGDAYIDSFNVQTQVEQIRQRMGYCPQFDALIDLMTGRELLTMYSRLRGVPEKYISQLIENLSKDLTVDSYIDKVSKTYSGGNKRKLSTAIALVGDPPLIFLDEPSSGMDPVARRMLWDSLSKFIALGKSIVITSHSMEECEALCTRLAIMVNGQFKCLGSPQHLKTKFGEGYTLIARVGGLNPNTNKLQQYIEETFPGSILKDMHQGYVHYQLRDTTKTWSNLFGIMEKIKTEFNIEDYSISQTTLEQVFMNFTRYQRSDDE